MRSTNEQVTSALTKAGINFTVTGKGTGLKRDNWECDGWMLELSHKNDTEYFDYFTGIGHRTPMPKPMDNGPMPRRGTLMYEQLEKQRKPVTPEICGIIYSLIMDSDAICESFDNWCNNFGYDSDSLKAFNIYQACTDNAKKMRKIIDNATLELLREALEDY